jgi:hypothetical protein
LNIYFNGNNKAHLEALVQCGVKNVMLSARYSNTNIKKFREHFDSIFVVAGTKTEPEQYHRFLKEKREYYDHAAQFDVFYDMEATLKHYKAERDMGIDWTLPVLQENYLNHISRLRPEPNSYVCLGEIRGRLDTDDQIRKLPRNLRYHGLAKGRYLEKRLFESLDTSTWISAAMSKKSEIWNANSTYNVFFGEKGRGMIPQLRHSCEVHKENLEKVGVKTEDIISGDYYALMKAPIALLFMPMCKSLNIYSENFKS